MPLETRLARALAAGFVALAFTLGATVADAQDKVRIAIAGAISEASLPLLVALERAKDSGLDYELTSYPDKDIAAQSIVAGDADVGIGAPYGAIQKDGAPLRIVFQLSTLVFYPVVAKEYKSWKSLDGKPFTFGAPGSPSETIGDVIAARDGFTFGERSYVPKPIDRVVKLLTGKADATFLDLPNKNLLMEQADKLFHLLPMPRDHPTDDAVFASEAWLNGHREQANILVGELFKLWREMRSNPSVIASERVARGLATDLPTDVAEGLTDYYSQATREGIYPSDGGGEDAAKADLEFYATAGQLSGPADSLAVEDFWDFGPLAAAREAGG